MNALGERGKGGGDGGLAVGIQRTVFTVRE